MQRVDRSTSLAAHTVGETAELANPGMDDSISTEEAAKLLSLTTATLRNYAWLLSMTKRERAMRALQEPPSGLPRPRRVRGRLKWKHREVLSYIEKKLAAQ